MIDLILSIKCYFVGHIWLGNEVWQCDRCSRLQFDTPIRRRADEKIIRAYMDYFSQTILKDDKFWIVLKDIINEKSNTKTNTGR